jgi:hypothetical protein
MQPHKGSVVPRGGQQCQQVLKTQRVTARLQRRKLAKRPHAKSYKKTWQTMHTGLAFTDSRARALRACFFTAASLLATMVSAPSTAACRRDA